MVMFVVAACFRFLHLRVEWARSLPPKPETAMTLMIAAAHWALSLALFSSILVTLNYCVRRKFSPLISIVCVMTLSFFISFGISAALERWKAVPPAHSAGVQLGGNGLILTDAMNKNETAVVLLRGTAEPLGPRVAAVPNQPLSYQHSANENSYFPQIQFGGSVPWFIDEMAVDINLNANLFRQKFTEGFYSYAIYAGTLIFLLCSVGYAIKFSAWPLANLFLATIVFRAILAFTASFNLPHMQEIISSFAGNVFPAALGLPLMFLAFGMLVNIYSLLSYASKRRKEDDF